MIIKLERNPSVRVHRLVQTSEEWKAKWGKKLIIVSIGKKVVENVDELEESKLDIHEMSYVFINDPYKRIDGSLDGFQPLDNWLKPPKLLPIDLNNYFEKAPDSDVAFQITPTQESAILDCRYIHSFVVLEKTSRLMMVDFRESFKQMVKREYSKTTGMGVEEWLNLFLNELPKPLYGEKYTLPMVIDEEQFSVPFKPKWREMSIGYCFRCSSLKREISIITELERSLRVAPKWIEIYDNYFQICSRIRDAAKKQKRKIILIPIMVEGLEIGLRIKNSDLEKLEMEYSIGDYLA